MKLWTIQPEEVYNLIMTKGIYRCNGLKSELINEWNYGVAYDWISQQMRNRIGLAPEGVKYPVWAWHTMNFKHKRPDMRKSEFRHIAKPYVLMEIEMPDNDVLLSDEVSWHFVLNDVYYPDAESEEEFDRVYNLYETQSHDIQHQMKHESWNKVLDIGFHSEYNWRDEYIQATFWELKKENVLKTWHYR